MEVSNINEKFFELPIEKQERIINAGFKVFSQNSYKKSPVSEIADAAGISKSLLFHYFHNKKELYLFLWETCAKITIEYLTESGCYEKTDFFEMLYSGMQAKIRIMKKYPDMGNFVVKAFGEQDSEVREEIRESYAKYNDFKANSTKVNVDPEQFIEGLDFDMMYREIYMAAEGYLWEIEHQGPVDVDKLEKDFMKLLDFWKQIYLRKKED